MNLGETITTLRKKNGWSQEELADKMGISRQSVSKWEMGSATPDIDKILKLSQLFGVSTDYLLKEETEVPVPGTEADMADVTETVKKPDKMPRFITNKEATDYLELVKNVSVKMGLAIMIFVLSPITVIILAGLSDAKGMISENAAAGIGVAVLLAMVAIGVAICIVSGMKLSRYEYLEKESIALDNSLVNMIKNESDAYQDQFIARITTGVVLCIIGVIPLVMGGVFEGDDFIMVCTVGVFLAMVSMAVFLFVSSGILKGAYNKLLQEGDFTESKKETNRKMEPYSGLYWSIIIIGYLLVSFLTKRWDITWVVWPVAGVLYGAVAGAINLAISAKERKD